MKRTDEAKECIEKISKVFSSNQRLMAENERLTEENIKNHKLLNKLTEIECGTPDVGCGFKMTKLEKRRLDTQDSCETSYKAEARDLVFGPIWESINNGYFGSKNSLSFLGLPCVNALFEHKLARDCHAVKGFQLHMDGAEYEDENIIQVLRNKPMGLNVMHGGLENLYFTEPEVNSAGVIIKVTELKNNGVAGYDVVWADYCGIMTEEKIAVNVELMARKEKVCKKNKKGFLLFLTFSAPRSSLAHELKEKRDTEGITLKKQMMSQFEEALTKANIVYSPILKFGYVGGKGTPMLTMGFAVGACTALPYVEIERAKYLEDKKYRDAINNYVQNLNNDIKFRWIGKYGEEVLPKTRTRVKKLGGRHRKMLTPIEVGSVSIVEKVRTSSKQCCEWMTEERKEIIRNRGWELRAQGLESKKVNDIIFGEVKHFDVRMRPKNVSATTSMNVFRYTMERENPEYRNEVEKKLAKLARK